MNLFYIAITLVNGKVLNYTKFNKQDAFLVKKMFQFNIGVRTIEVTNDKDQRWLYHVA